MSTVATLTRLQLNFAEVPGVARSFLFEPISPVDTADLPCTYPVQIGQMTTFEPDRPGSYIVTRRFVYRLLIVALAAASTDSGNSGAYIDTISAGVVDAPLDYFMVHPRLDTSAGLSELAFLHFDIQLQDSGIVTRQGPGGAQYRAVDYTFTIAERRIPTPARLS